MDTTRISPPDRGPGRSSGNLYYVRLTTPLGLFYKLGFTTLGSVWERLAYQDNGHEEHIHSVFCFAHFEDALDVEITLHKHFGHRAAFPIAERDMPFFGNGQSELYAEDILRMDEDYTEAQYAETIENIRRVRLKRAGKSDNEIDDHIRSQEDVDELITRIREPMVWLMRAYEKVVHFLFGYPNGKPKRADIHKLIRRVQNAKCDPFHIDAQRARKARLERSRQEFLAATRNRK